MIKFEFVLDDLDAENLVYAIRESALRNDEYIMDWQSKVHSGECTQVHADQYINWHKANKEYLLGLITKMTNVRINNETEN